MQKHLFICIFFTYTLFSYASAFAWEWETFEAYKKRATEQCETDKPWVKTDEWWGNIVPIPDYGALNRWALEKSRDTLLSQNTSSERREKLINEISLLNSANQDAFNILELARIKYKSSLDRVFWCAVVQSRENILNNLIWKIEEKYPSRQTEIREKLNRELKKLKAQKDGLSCIAQSGDKNTPQSTRVINASIRQYCHYDSYLRYLRTNIDDNNQYILELEASLFTPPWISRQIPTDTASWSRKIAQASQLVSTEIARARAVLPRAIDTFREMDRTYGTHIMLVIIYDDYLQFRDNLWKYFNTVAQLMEKIQNAQSPNNK